MKSNSVENKSASKCLQLSVDQIGKDVFVPIKRTTPVCMEHQSQVSEISRKSQSINYQTTIYLRSMATDAVSCDAL